MRATSSNGATPSSSTSRAQWRVADGKIIALGGGYFNISNSCDAVATLVLNIFMTQFVSSNHYQVLQPARGERNISKNSNQLATMTREEQCHL